MKGAKGERETRAGEGGWGGGRGGGVGAGVGGVGGHGERQPKSDVWRQRRSQFDKILPVMAIDTIGACQQTRSTNS